MKRNTTQRQAILHIFRSAQGPMSAEEIHQQALLIKPNIGIATIYRNLKELVQAKDVSEVHLPEQTTRFELTRPEHHHHFFCERCQHVFDVKAACPVAALDGATLPSGFNVTSHKLTLYGVCSSCQ